MAATDPAQAVKVRAADKEVEGWMRHARTSDDEVSSLRSVFVHDCEDFIHVESEAEADEEILLCAACHVAGMLVYGALQRGVRLPGALVRLANDLPSSGLRNDIRAYFAAVQPAGDTGAGDA